MNYLGGWLSVLSGILLFIAHAISLGKDDSIIIISETLVLSAHVLLVFAFFWIYSVQKRQNGFLGLSGMVTGVFGTIFVTAIVYVEIAGASGVKVEDVFASSVPKFIHFIGPLLFVVGMILIGASIIRGKVFPQLGGVLLILGTIIFAAGSFAGNAEEIFSVIGSAVTGGGFVWVGFASRKENLLE